MVFRSILICLRPLSLLLACNVVLKLAAVPLEKEKESTAPSSVVSGAINLFVCAVVRSGGQNFDTRGVTLTDSLFHPVLIPF